MWEEELGCNREKISMRHRRNITCEGSEMESSWEPSRNEEMASVSGNCAKAEVWREVEVVSSQITQA